MTACEAVVGLTLTAPTALRQDEWTIPVQTHLWLGAFEFGTISPCVPGNALHFGADIPYLWLKLGLFCAALSAVLYPLLLNQALARFDGFVLQMMNFAFKTMNFALKMTDFAPQPTTNRPALHAEER